MGTGESAIRSGFTGRPARAAGSLSIFAPRSSIFPFLASDRGSAPDRAETLARPGNMSAPTLKTDRNRVQNDQKSFKIDRKTSKNDQKTIKIDRKTASVIRRSQPSDSQNALVFPTNIAPSASATTWHTPKNRPRKSNCCKCALQELFPPKSPIGNAWPRIMVAPCHAAGTHCLSCIIAQAEATRLGVGYRFRTIGSSLQSSRSSPSLTVTPHPWPVSRGGRPPKRKRRRGVVMSSLRR